MRLSLALSCLCVCAYVCSFADALTNQELFDVLEPYIVVEDNISDWDDVTDESEGILEFPGGPDDEVDIVYLMVALMNPPKQKEPKLRDLSWWAWHHHGTSGCRCHHDGCECCTEHTWKITIFKTFRAHLKACIKLNYLPKDSGYDLSFTVNGHRLYHKEIHLKPPPSICLHIPGLGSFARACLELYDINLRTKHVCVRLAGYLDLKIHEFKIHLKLGCFTIPIKDGSLTMEQVSDNFRVWMEEANETDPEVADMTVEKFRKLQNSEE